MVQTSRKFKYSGHALIYFVSSLVEGIPAQSMIALMPSQFFNSVSTTQMLGWRSAACALLRVSPLVGAQGTTPFISTNLH